MKTIHRFSTLALFLAVSGLANVAFSQGAGGGGAGGGGGGGGGPTGGGGTGGVGTGGTSFGNTGSNFGTGSTSGNSGNSGTGTGAATAINGRKYTSVGAKPQTTTGNRRYASVGAKSSSAGARGATGAGGAGGLGGGAGLGTSSFGLNQTGTKTGSTETNPTVRTRLSSGVAVAPSSQYSTQAIVPLNASRSMAQTRFRGVGITANDSATVIGGTVKSESDRRMAELLLRLEPGVSRVENRITVAP